MNCLARQQQFYSLCSSICIPHGFVEGSYADDLSDQNLEMMMILIDQ